MSTNLQLSLRQLAPIECKRRSLVGGPVSPFLLLLFSPPFYFLALTSSDPRRWKPSRHVHAIAASELHARRLSDEFPLSPRGLNEPPMNGVYLNPFNRRPLTPLCVIHLAKFIKLLVQLYRNVTNFRSTCHYYFRRVKAEDIIVMPRSEKSI